MVRLLSGAALAAMITACAERDRPVTKESLAARQRACSFQNAVAPGPDSVLIGGVLRYLEVMREPRIGAFVDSSDTEIFRFLWLRSFEPPIAVRAIRRGGEYALVSAKLGNDDDNCPGKLIRSDSVRLSDQRWRRLMQAVRDSQLEPSPRPKQVTGDGTVWIVESVVSGRYRAITVLLPATEDRPSQVPRLGLELVRNAGLMPWPWDIH